MNTELNLDVAHSAAVVKVLRAAVDKFNESASELASAWQDETAGKVWSDLAKILDRAADSAEKTVKRYGFE